MKKDIKIGVGIALLFMAIGVSIKIVQINREYPQVQKKVISVGEMAEMKTETYMKVKSAKWLSEKEAVEKYGAGFSDEMEEGYEYAIAEVTVELENRSGEEQGISLYEIYLETDTYCNGLAPEVMGSMEPPQEMEMTLPAGKKKEVTLGYVLYKLQFTDKQWKNLKSMEFYLVNQRYPVKTKWRIS